MSSDIDKRIVEMQFDNKQFEKGIQTSVQSLDKLKQSLNLEKSVKGLAGLEKAGRSLNLSHIGDSVAVISNRFSAMGIVGMTTLQNIANSAYNCGKRMLKSFTIDPVKTGFAEYETQIGAIQTILANTSDAMDKAGYSQQQRLDIVNDKLDELNSYADKTIYNFTEMTRNIGTFTAAGVDLDTSVSSIKGIANLAAVSGSTSQQASTAMYQLSQAISTGTVRLMDWNSVVNAGMGGELFQKALMRTADNMGIVDKKAKETFAQLKAGKISFRDSLSSGWLSSDILTATLSQISMDFEQIAKTNGLLLKDGSADIEAAKNLMRSSLSSQGYGADEIEQIISLAETATDAATKVKTLTQLFDTMKESVQSGWTQTWEYVIGDFEEAKELLTSISDYFGNIIGASAESRNAMMADWKALGGRNELINSFWNIIHTIENVTGTVKKSFQEFFPPTTGKQIFDITKKIVDFTEKMKAATENSELMGKVGRVFSGAAAGLDILRSAAGKAWGGLKKLFGLSEGVAVKFLEFGAKIGDSIVNLRNSMKTSGTIQGILTGLGNAATAVRNEVVGGLKAVGSYFKNTWNQIKASGVFTKIGDWLNSTISKIPEGIAQIKAFGKSIVDWVKNSETLKTAWSNVKGFFEPILTGISDFGKALWNAIRSFFGVDVSGNGSFWDQAGERFVAFGEKMSEWFSTIKPQMEAGWNKAKASVTTFFTKTIPEYFSNLKIKAVIKWPWLEKAFAFFEQLRTKVRDSVAPAVDTIKRLGASLWTNIKKLFGGDKIPKENELTFGEVVMDAAIKSWESIKTFFSEFVTITIPKWIDKLKGIDWGTLLKTALGLTGIVKIVSMASGLSKLGAGMSSVGKGLKNIGGVLKNIGKDGLTITKVFKKDSFATSMLKVAGAIGIMVGSIVILANMEAGKAFKGIGLLTLISSELLIITAIFKKIDANGDALIKAAGAVALLVIPVYLLGKLDTGTALKGMMGVGLILTELALFMRIAGKGMRGKQSFLGLSVAVNLLVLAVKNLGEMDIGSAIKGVIGLGLVMLELSLFMNKTNTNKMAGMISMAVAMNVLVRAVRKMGSLNAKTIAKGVLGIGGILAAFSVLMKTSKGMKFGNTLTLLLGMAGSMILFVEMFKQVEGMNSDDMTKFAASLAVTMLSIAAAMKIISTIPIMGALKGVGSFAILIVGIGGVIAALGWLQSEWGGMTDFLERGGNVLGQIGKALGSFIGGIGAGIVGGMNLTQLGTDLTDFMNNSKGFIDGAKNVTAETATGVGYLTGAIIAIAGSEFLSALASLFAGENPVTKFSTDIQTLGRALTSYAFAVLPMALVPSTVLDRSVSVATALAGVAREIPATGGIMKLINGIGDLGDFSSNVKSLGTGLADFAKEISAISDEDFNQTKVDAVVAVANGLASLESNLEGQGGWEDRIEGIKSLSGFGTEMEPFAAGLNAFIDQVKLINYDPQNDSKKLYAVMDIGTALSTLEKNLEAQGGLSDAISGIKSLSGFGNELPAFAGGLNSFISQTSTLDDEKYDQDKIDKALAVASAINELNKNLPSTDGWVQGIMGTQDLGLFSENIKKVGEALSSFSTSVSNSTVNQAEDAVTALDVIRTFTSTLSAEGGLWDDIGKFFGGSSENTLLGYAKNMATVGTDLNTFSTKIEDVDITNIDKASQVIESIGTFLDGLTASGSVFESIGNFFAGSKGSTLITMSGYMATFGNNIGQLAAGISNIETTATNFEGAKTLFESFKTFNDTVATYGDIDYSDQMSDLLWILDDFGLSLSSFGTNLSTTDVDSLSTASSIIETLVSLAGTAAGITPSSVGNVGSILEEYGAISLAGFVTGFNNSTGDAVSAVNALLEQLSFAIQNDATVSIAAFSLSGAAVAALRLTRFMWFAAGMYLGSGIARGISSMAGAIRGAAIGAASGAIQAIRITWSINSPSKVGEGLGEFWDLGIAKGMDKYAYVVNQSSAGIGENAITTAKSMLNNMSRLTDGIDAEPTIRPVMDLSDIMNGVTTMDGLFSANHAVNGTFFGGMNGLRTARDMMQNPNTGTTKVDNTDVVEELRTLQSQFDELSVKITNLQIVLDSGELVGKTAPMMNKELGVAASRNGRAN